MFLFGNRESGSEVADFESRKSERTEALRINLEDLKTNSYSNEQFDSIKKNLSEIVQEL